MARTGSLLREARRRAGLTQQAAAERIGVTQSMVARWENGRATPTLDRLVVVLRLLGYDLQYFLVEDDWVQRAQAADASALPVPDRVRANARLVEVGRRAGA